MKGLSGGERLIPRSLRLSLVRERLVGGQVEDQGGEDEQGGHRSLPRLGVEEEVEIYDVRVLFEKTVTIVAHLAGAIYEVQMGVV